MVRIVSQNFSPPRSRHSSGETDRDLAERAHSALSTFSSKKMDLHEWESSSDSFWDSEFDGEQSDVCKSDNHDGMDEINGNRNGKSDLHLCRKERRRERNKVSAQLYRKRQRQNNARDQEVLTDLEDRNRHLTSLVEHLEKKTQRARQLLRNKELVTLPEILELTSEMEADNEDKPLSKKVKDTKTEENRNSITTNFSDIPSSCQNNQNEVLEPQSTAATQLLINANTFIGNNAPITTMATFFTMPINGELYTSRKANIDSASNSSDSNSPIECGSPQKIENFTFANNLCRPTFSEISNKTRTTLIQQNNNSQIMCNKYLTNINSLTGSKNVLSSICDNSTSKAVVSEFMPNSNLNNSLSSSTNQNCEQFQLNTNQLSPNSANILFS